MKAKLSLFLLALLSLALPSARGSGYGSIVFQNRNSPTAAFSGFYSIPIYIDLNGDGIADPNEGIGTYAASVASTAMLALYRQGDTTIPIATAQFRGDTNGMYLGNPASQTIYIQEWNPGQRAPLTVRAWIGGTYDTAGIRGSWDFLSQPLGGTPDTGLPIIPPGMSGWGDETTSAGFLLQFPSPPVAVTDHLARDAASDLTIPISTLLANDTDPGKLKLNFLTVDTVSAHGASIAFFVGSGTIQYTHRDFGDDSFGYVIQNAAGASARGRVEITAVASSGLIAIGNQNVPLPTGGTYNIPISVDLNGNNSADPGEGLGTFAATAPKTTATLGLFLQGQTTPLGTANFRVDAQGAFLGVESTTVVVPGYAPGARAPLTVKVWIGESFANSPLQASWDFTSEPLGGTANFPIPGLSGWGDPVTGAGYLLHFAGPALTAGTDKITRIAGNNLTVAIADLLVNDVDSSGGSVIFYSVDPVSANGSTITPLADGTIRYIPRNDSDDSFYYTIRNTAGAYARGRVDVVVTSIYGTILFANRNLLYNNEFYQVPISVDLDGNGVADTGEGLGTIATKYFGLPATLALYLQGEPKPLATAGFRTDINGIYVGFPSSQTVQIPGIVPGTRAALTVKAWIGTNYETALVRASWDFTSEPLGGVPENGLPIVPPTMSGWGDPSGKGYLISIPQQPVAGFDTVFRKFGTDAKIYFNTLLANDHDPMGGTLSVVGLPPTSANGALLTRAAGYVTYSHRDESPDYFYYVVGNATGGLAIGRVNITVTGALIDFTNQGIPIYVDANMNGVPDATEGLGLFASSLPTSVPDSYRVAHLGLYLKGSSTPLAVSDFDDLAPAFIIPKRVLVPGHSPGERLLFTVKAWTGASYETAPVLGSWDFQADPLGGTSDDGSVTLPVPNLSAWTPPGSAIGYTVHSDARSNGGGPVIQSLVGNMTTFNLSSGLTTLIGVPATSALGGALSIEANNIHYQCFKSGSDFLYYMALTGGSGSFNTGRVDIVNGAGLIFGNRDIPKSSGAGQTYRVPIYVDANFNGQKELTEAIGAFASATWGSAAQVELDLASTSTVLATGTFANDTTGLFTTLIGGTTPVYSKTLIFPTNTPGERINLTLKVWAGATAYSSAPLQKSWTFLSAPLGGSTATTNCALLGLDGWGPEDNSGILVAPGQKPVTRPDTLVRLPGQGGTISVATVLSNDSDPGGGALNIRAVDTASANGGRVTLSGGTITYSPASTSDNSHDWFFYTARNSQGGYAVGSVDVFATGPAIVFANKSVPTASGASTYDIPVWVDANFNGLRDADEGLGTFAKNVFNQSATLGIFEQGQTTAFATALFSNASNGAFLGSPASQVIYAPHGTVGQSSQLTVKAWIGNSGSTPLSSAWVFNSKPLGGAPTPGLTGLGAETGEGLVLIPGQKPVAGNDRMVRLIGQNGNISVTALLSNDSDPAGGAVSLRNVSSKSENGASVSISGLNIIYTPISDNADSFTYTVRNSLGGYSTGRVDVAVTGATIVFATRSIETLDGLSIYDAPIWVDANFNGVRDLGEGYGTHATNIFKTYATLGLFERGNDTPFATAIFRSDGNGAFLGTPAVQTVAVPSGVAGQRSDLTIKVWMGPSYTTSPLKASWDFTSQPLGGTPPGGFPIVPPYLTGFGPENSSGFAINPGQKPIVGPDMILRVAGQDVKVQWHDLLANDSDPDGNPLSFSLPAASSVGGSTLARSSSGDWVYYFHTDDLPDFFTYTARNSLGGYAEGRVDVLLAGADYQSSTRAGVDIQPDGAHITFHGVPGQHYLVQFRDTLDPNEAWIDFQLATDMGAGIFKCFDSGGSASRFYRILYRP